ncbi:DUF2752 domain-containing protein [Alkalicella caledoniensis]|uniref:DUF2752 domain-containing protein n=1 Tax=Alkalicella caledoniensis TaxID=2731377 RepID=A0A7G9W6C3_ALKCA|nr:DUF2752 domain-containing protein [Alkalicella caledoniensis]QNO14235.1 DUF2752 domain-containing protein [Alkalicella caledoniensis]
MFKNEFTYNPKLQRLLALGFLLGIALIIYIYHPATPYTMITSPFRQVTGFYCPGCGTIRAMTQLLKGNILKAASHNILAVIFSPLLLWIVASNISLVIIGKPLPRPELPSKGIWILLTVVIVYGVARNLPISQLQFLRP